MEFGRGRSSECMRLILMRGAAPQRVKIKLQEQPFQIRAMLLSARAR